MICCTTSSSAGSMASSTICSSSSQVAFWHWRFRVARLCFPARVCASAISLWTRFFRLIVAYLVQQAFEFLDPLDQVHQFDGLDGVVEDAQGSPDLVAGMAAGQVPFQGLDGPARGPLQPADRGFHDAPPGLAVGGLELREAQPPVRR